MHVDVGIGDFVIRGAITNDQEHSVKSSVTQDGAFRLFATAQNVLYFIMCVEPARSEFDRLG